jgi:hypothetical protein
MAHDPPAGSSADPPAPRVTAELSVDRDDVPRLVAGLVRARRGRDADVLRREA